MAGEGAANMLDALLERERVIPFGEFVGEIKDTKDAVLRIDGLWALSFGNGAQAGPFNSLFFTAGIQKEAHGLFGTLTAVPGELTEGNGR